MFFLGAWLVNSKGWEYYPFCRTSEYAPWWRKWVPRRLQLLVMVSPLQHPQDHQKLQYLHLQTLDYHQGILNSIMDEGLLFVYIFSDPVLKQKAKRKVEDLQCAHCDAVFKYKFNMTEHLKLYHSDQPNPFSCDQCNLSFKTKHNLKRHLEKSCIRKLIYWLIIMLFRRLLELYQQNCRKRPII